MDKPGKPGRKKGNPNPNAIEAMAEVNLKYRSSFNKQAEKLCKLGATDEELADFFEVNKSTIIDWKNRYPAFANAVKKGKMVADMEVADKLYQRACGYSHKAVKIFQYNGTIVKEEYIEHYPPDATSMIFWLKNRQRKKWRDKLDHEVSGKDGAPITLNINRNYE